MLNRWLYDCCFLISFIVTASPLAQGIALAQGITTPSAVVQSIASSNKNLMVHKGSSLEWWYFTGPLWRGSDCDNLGFNSKRPPDFGFQKTYFYSGQGKQRGLLLHSAESLVQQKKHHTLSFAQPLPANTLELPMAKLSESWLDIRLAQHSLLQLGQKVLQSWVLRTQNGNSEYSLLIEVNLDLLWKHGKDGFIEKTPGVGNFYETLPFLPTKGVRRNLANNTIEEVCGSLWFDHEWNVKNVNDLQWNWFALRNATGDAFMLYTIFSMGAEHNFGEYFSARQSKFVPVQNLSIRQTKTDCLKSKNCYPTAFEIKAQVEKVVYSFSVAASFPEQEFSNSIGKNYWEGIINIKNHDKNWGLGYLEMARNIQTANSHPPP